MIKTFSNIRSNTHGITLISLIITIIILIILASITISLTIGKNGIITRAKEVAQQTEKASILEKIQLELFNKQSEEVLAGKNGEITQTEIENILSKYGTINKNQDETIKSLIPTGKKYEILYEEIINDNMEIVRDSSTYTVEYNSNTTEEVTNIPNNQEISKEKEVQVAIGKPIWDKHIFLGWSTNQNSTTVQYYPGDNYTQKESIKLYAVWIQEVEYIETTGTQYIDTGIKFNSTTMKLGIKVFVPPNVNGGNCAFGVRSTIGETTDALKGFYQCSIYTVVADDNENQMINTNNGDIIYQFERNELNYNGTNVITKYCTNTQYNLFLFTLNSNGNNIANALNGTKIYYSKIWNSKNNELLQDLMPCLDSNNVPCFYDKVTTQLFYNQGTGDFNYKTLNS